MDKLPIYLPFYVKASLLLIGIYYFISMLSMAQGIILPVLYAGIIAILIGPVVNFLVKKKINRALAIAGILACTFFLVVIFAIVLSTQFSRFSEALPHLADKFQELLNQAIAGFSAGSNISTQLINEWIAKTKGELLSNSGAAIGTTFSTMGGILATLFLTPVYI